MEALVYQSIDRQTRIANSRIFSHILLGLLIFLVPEVAVYYGLVYWAYGMFRTVYTRNSNNDAGFTAIYLVSLELIIRMTKFVALYEFGKYSAISLLLVGLLVERSKRPLPTRAILYFLFLLPAIAVVDFSNFDVARKLISFNLSGPLSLALSWLYFSNRKFDKVKFRKFAFLTILPIISILTFIILKILTSSTLYITEQSSKDLSGGFGPNQVSVVLGYGFTILTMALILGQTITSSKALDFILALTFLAFAGLTLSRGGVMVSIFAFLVMGYYYLRQSNISQKYVRLLIGGAVFGMGIIALWTLLNTFTGDIFQERYVETFKPKEAHQAGAIDVSGRDVIALQDLMAFAQNPILGTGPGGTVVFRENVFGYYMASHTEYTRVLGDHGIFGLMALLIMFYQVWLMMRRNYGRQKIFFMGLISISLLNMLHQGMRLAIPGIVFGIAMITLDFEDHPLETGKSSTR